MKVQVTIPPCACGADAKLKRSQTGLTASVVCTRCDKRTDFHCTTEAAVRAWTQKVKT